MRTSDHTRLCNILENTVKTDIGLWLFTHNLSSVFCNWDNLCYIHLSGNSLSEREMLNTSLSGFEINCATTLTAFVDISS